jgi:hypothetical protein
MRRRKEVINFGVTAHVFVLFFLFDYADSATLQIQARKLLIVFFK